MNIDNSYYEQLQRLKPMSTADGLKCYKQKSYYCPPGHEMKECTVDGESGRTCTQCGSLTFQPNNNKLGDQCRLKRSCHKFKMHYVFYGNSTHNAECVCEKGYHFEHDDQRACVPNIECGKGYGQGEYEDGRLTGVCERCIDKDAFSDTSNNVDTCKPLRNCRKEGRCILVQSNGTFDRKCGPVVKDVNDCDSILTTTTAPSTSAQSSAAVIGGAVGGILFLLLILLIVLFCISRRRRAAKQDRVQREQLEDLLPEIIKRSKKDELYCKNVLDLLQKEVEDRINNQIWALAQELFRNHLEPAKYEVILEKLKDAHYKFAINSYMQDWRSWRGNYGDAVEELVTCLKSPKVKRVDIVLEVVSKLRKDFPEVVEVGNKRNKRKPGPASFCCRLVPCYEEDNRHNMYECKDTSKSLLADVANNEKDANNHVNNYNAPPPSYPRNHGHNDGGNLSPAEAGVIYRSAATPSAPVLEVVEEDDHLRGQHFYDRSDSVPVVPKTEVS